MGKVKELATLEEVVFEPKKVFYMNDTVKPVRVFVDGLGKDHFQMTLEPQTASNFIVNVPTNGHLFFKHWEGTVLITYYRCDS